MPTAKALAGAITAIIVFIAAEVGLDLPDAISGALLTIITGLVVWRVPNKERTESVASGGTSYSPPAAHSFWPVAVLPLAADRVSEGEALFWIGILVVVGCLVAAAVAAFKYLNYIAAGVLVVVAIVAALLLL